MGDEIKQKQQPHHRTPDENRCFDPEVYELYQIKHKNMTKKMRNLKKDSHQRKDGIMSVNQASILMPR